MDDTPEPPKFAFPLNYTYRAEWDPERSEYIARCLEFPGRSATAFTAHDAVAAMEKVVDDELDELASLSMQPPVSLTDHRYSGTFLVRTSRAMHSRLTVEAAEQRVSLNHWVAAKLADRRPTVSIDDLFD
jgi:predicted HicB family RNase H-like nuclease